MRSYGRWTVVTVLLRTSRRCYLTLRSVVTVSTHIDVRHGASSAIQAIETVETVRVVGIHRPTVGTRSTAGLLPQRQLADNH